MISIVKRLYKYIGPEIEYVTDNVYIEYSRLSDNQQKVIKVVVKPVLKILKALDEAR